MTADAIGAKPEVTSVRPIAAGPTCQPRAEPVSVWLAELERPGFMPNGFVRSDGL